MRNILRVDRLREGRLIESREQLSRSYLADFMRVLYTQQSQASTFMSPAAANLGMNPWPGHIAWGIGQSYGYGIVVGRGSTAAAPTDTSLEYPIGHGRIYKAALQPKLTNPSFETGDFTGWGTSSPGSVVEGGFAGATGKFYWNPSGAVTRYITQSLDFTNITAIKFAYYISFSSLCSVTLYYNGTPIYQRSGSGGFANQHYIIPVSTSGVKTFKVEYTGTNVPYAYIDSFEVYGTQFEYGASECTYPTFSGPDGEMTLKRYFQNRSGGSVTVNEVGIIAYPGRLVLRDVVSPGVPVNNGETLRVTYQIQIAA